MSSQGVRPRTGDLELVVRCCGDVTFDFARRVVIRGSAPLDLSEAYLAALFLLVERSPNSVSKGELGKAAGTSEDTLYKVIETIRRALGDTGEPRRLIVTERGVGYRFIGELISPTTDAHVESGEGLKQPLAPQDPKADRVKRWGLIAALCLFVLLGAAAIARYRHGNAVAMLGVEGPFVIARDAGGKELWRHVFEHGLDSVRYTPSLMPGRYWLGDLEGDGSQEALFLVDGAAQVYNHRREESSLLYCFSQVGQVKWSFQVGHTVRDRQVEIHPPYRAEGMLVISSAGSRSQSRIIVGSGHTTDQAYQLAFLDPRGNLMAEYWHPGSLYLLTSIPSGPGGAPRLLAGGVNNGEHRATLIELDPFAIRGASTPSRMRDLQFRLLDMPEAHEELVILFPRTCLSRNEPYTRTGGLAAVDGAVHMNIIESFDPASKRVVFYDFDQSLRLTRAVVSSDYREEHLKLEQAGAIHHSWREDEAALGPGIEYRPKAP